MKYIVVSEANLASRNIGNFLGRPKAPKGVRIIRTKNNVLDLESDLKNIKDAEIVIVASTHKSEAKVPMLNAHFTGNFGEDVSHGGSARTLSIAPALYQRAAVLEYQKLQKINSKLKDYVVGIEATHHGPTLDLPILFVEVGSSEKEWNDLIACEAAAKVILKLVSEMPENAPEQPDPTPPASQPEKSAAKPVQPVPPESVAPLPTFNDGNGIAPSVMPPNPTPPLSSDGTQMQTQ